MEYNAYFDIYRTYYYSIKKYTLFHYNALSVYEKINNLGITINETLDDYTGFFIKKDKMYKRLNPNIQISENYKIKNFKSAIFTWFNKKSFEKTFEPLIEEIRNILININSTRFFKDEKSMKETYNKLYK